MHDMSLESVEIKREPDGRYTVSVNGQTVGTVDTLRDAVGAYETKINAGKENENG